MRGTRAKPSNSLLVKRNPGISGAVHNRINRYDSFSIGHNF